MKLWDLKAPLYRWFRKPFPLNLIHERERYLVEELLALVPPESRTGRVLDLGCGIGDTAVDHAGPVIGLDTSAAMLARHPRQYDEALVAGDALMLPFQDGQFSLIQSIGLSEYIENLEVLLAECARCLTPGGYLLLTGSPFTWFSWARAIGGNRLWLRSSGETVALAEQWFACVHVLEAVSITTILFIK